MRSAPGTARPRPSLVGLVVLGSCLVALGVGLVALGTGFATAQPAGADAVDAEPTIVGDAEPVDDGPDSDRSRFADGFESGQSDFVDGTRPDRSSFGTEPRAAAHPVADLTFEPNETAVEPGETVELDVELAVYRDIAGSGARSVTLRLDYPAEHVAVTNLRTASWFSDDPDAVETAAWIDPDAGAAALERTLVNPGDGVARDGRIATATVEVAEDAPQRSIAVTAQLSMVYYVGEDYPSRVYGRPAVLDVDGGGGELLEPTIDVTHEFDDEHAVEPSSPDEAGDGGADDGTDDDGDPIPLPVGVALVGGLAGGLLVRLRRRRPPRRRPSGGGRHDAP